jgi:diguanylate cyclase (GGDEF)-like protein
MALEYGSKMSTGRLLTPVAAYDDHLVFMGQYTTAIARHGDRRFDRIFCDLIAGFYARVPSLFGYLGTVAETSCQLDGAEHCEFRMAWRPDPSVEDPGPVDTTASAERTASYIERFEELQSMATAMVAVDDVDAVLERIIEQASRALSAPQYLLVVDAGDGRTRAHSVGFASPRVADALGGRLLDGELGDNAGIATAPVRFGDRHFGWLAAIFAKGTTVTDVEERLLAAYANHAGAALNVIAALQAARRDRDTAQVLLSLARSLSDVVSAPEIAALVCDAVPGVVDCDGSSVYLYDGDAVTLSLAATTARDETVVRPVGSTLTQDALPALVALALDPQPLLLTPATAPNLRATFEAFGVERVAIVPIESRGAFLGVVTAGFVDATDNAHEVDPLLFDRLTALADHAATALENAELLDRMRHEALHDPITGLPNRILIEDRGRQAFAQANRAEDRVGLLFIDLDRFKNINDTLGHHAGDEVIRAVADRLDAMMREGDTLARLGGDEFVVLLPRVRDAEDCVRVASRLIESLKEPFAVAGHELFLSCSIGIACSPDHGTNYESLLQYADSAMYSAKNHGRSTFAVDAASVATPRRRQLLLEGQLHRALENDELRVYYQPQVDLRTNEIVGAEALVRWEHPTEGLLLPGAFLQLAEESGLVVAIDEWVRVQAFRQARRWADQGRNLRMAVNLCARTLSNPDLAEVIAGELAATGADPTQIELEINENVAMSDVDELPAALTPLRALGLRIAIDDFGTGNSVLRRLQHCEIDTLKIDRTFLSAVTAGSLEVPLIKALLALAQSLDLTVVAEGVETEAQAQLLTRYACDIAQGFLYGKAVPADDFGTLVPTARSVPLDQVAAWVVGSTRRELVRAAS